MTVINMKINDNKKDCISVNKYIDNGPPNLYM